MADTLLPLFAVGLVLCLLENQGQCYRGAFASVLRTDVWRSLKGFDIPRVKHNVPEKKYLAHILRSAGATNTSDSRLGPLRPVEARELPRRRCGVARGSWCGQYLYQQPVPTRLVPRGARHCPKNCSGWGNCNHDSGLCECPAGWGGTDCSQEVKRPCSNRYRHPHEHDKTTVGHLGPDKHDLDPKERGWLASRCYGYCEDNLALCFCGYNSTYRHVPAPPGSPPWTPPVQWGRAMADHCMIGTDKDGQQLEWGRPSIRYEDIYGPDGWCNKLNSAANCGCGWDGNAWPCDGSRLHESYCANQCTGHGECHMGFCRCHAGWYGQDCSRKMAGLELDQGHLDRPWLKETVVVPPASLLVPAKTHRLRPLIYVYDIPPAYTSRMLQYRIVADACVWRRFNDINDTYVLSTTYAVELYFHEMLLQSEHRTYDPEEADFFYVPLYITCYMWPVLGWADFPWWHAPYAHSRPMQVANMLVEVHQWLTGYFPWWNRRGGRDHIFLMAHDEGACYMPTHIYNASIVLTHWGRLDEKHTSGSAYDQDRYDAVVQPDIAKRFGGWPGFDWQDETKGHPCYNPEKDLVIPAFKAPSHFHMSPLLGAPPLERDILLYFRGDIGAGRQPHYSRGIRQELFRLAHHHDWAAKYRILIGTGETTPGSYSEHLARSKFCLVAPGDGWSPRAEDAILHGCVPLVIMDGVHAVFEGILDWDAFALRIRESALESVPDILMAMPPERLSKMQRNIARIWHRFAYATGPVMRRQYEAAQQGNRIQHPAAILEASHRLTQRESAYRPLMSFPFEDDAFSTIMQWLFHRINETR